MKFDCSLSSVDLICFCFCLFGLIVFISFMLILCNEKASPENTGFSSLFSLHISVLICKFVNLAYAKSFGSNDIRF